MATKIIINRKNEWLNRMRRFTIFIDDKEVGAVKNGSSEEFVVEPGVHNIYLKFAFYKSIPINVTVNADEKKFLLARNGMKYFWAMYFLLIVALVSSYILNHVYHNQNLSQNIVIVCIVPIVLYSLYYLTFGRKKYLLLEIDKENIFNS